MDAYGIGWEVLPSSTEDETGRHAAILMTIHSLKGEFNFIGAKVKLTLDGLYRDNCLEELVVPGAGAAHSLCRRLIRDACAR